MLAAGNSRGVATLGAEGDEGVSHPYQRMSFHVPTMPCCEQKASRNWMNSVPPASSQDMSEVLTQKKTRPLAHEDGQRCPIGETQEDPCEIPPRSHFTVEVMATE